jgi:hypothetical protein
MMPKSTRRGLAWLRIFVVVVVIWWKQQCNTQALCHLLDTRGDDDSQKKPLVLTQLVHVSVVRSF